MTTNTMQPKIVEKNTWNHIACLNCGKLFQMENLDGPIELSTRCDRCKCPLEDIPAALKFIDEQAEGQHDPAITLMGKKLRGEQDVPLPAVDLEEITQSVTASIRESIGDDIKEMVASGIAEGMKEILAIVTEAKIEPEAGQPKGK